MTDELDPKPDGESQETPDEVQNPGSTDAPANQPSPVSDDAAVQAAADDGDVAVAKAEGDALEASGSRESASEPEDAMLKALEDLPQDPDKINADDINFDSPSASRAEFQQLQEPVSDPDPRNIDLLMDVDLPISIELGRTKLSISDILGLGPGSVVELNKLAGEPVDLLVNYKVVARGEVVVVDENFGLRITQLMTPEERLKALAEA